MVKILPSLVYQPTVIVRAERVNESQSRIHRKSNHGDRVELAPENGSIAGANPILFGTRFAH